MRLQANRDWSRNRTAVAVAIPFPTGFEEISMRNTLVAVCDTLVVLSMQLVFRATMILRRLHH
jgi:hypothetical protein